MTSAHRYPPPQTSSQNDFRLPSLKDLNFAYRPPVSGPQAALPPAQAADIGAVQQEHPQSTSRHPTAWGRPMVNGSVPAPSPVTVHQQHTTAPKVDYATKHENGGYAHPGLPLSAQATPVPGSVNTRNENPTHSPNQPKRQRTSSSTSSMPRDPRSSHTNGYPPPQYASYHSASQAQQQQSPYHSTQHNLTTAPPPPPPHASQSAPSPHEPAHHPPPPMPVTAHNGYNSYSHSGYIQPRQTLLHPHSSPHPPAQQQTHSNPYPSSAPPAPPPSAPQNQGSWPQSHHQSHQQPQHHQPPPPPPPHHQQAPPSQQPPPPQTSSSQHGSQHGSQQHTSQQHNPHTQSHTQPSYHHHPQHHQQPHQPHQPHQPPPTTITPSSMHNVPPHQPAPPPPPPSAPSQAPPSHQPSVQPPPQQYNQQYPPPPPPSQSFNRPTTVAPTALDTRQVYTPAPPEPARSTSVQHDAMSEITAHCNILHGFAQRYASLQQHSMHHAQPPLQELEEMSRRAMTVVRLLQEFRQMNLPDDGESSQLQASPSQSTPEESRPPKRPWEDVSQDDGAASSEVNGFQDQFPANPPAPPDSQQVTTAEQDMELIRTKRATSTAVANGTAGQPKSKYRKRSRASPPGKCHSCNIRETPEWRRGPDGARTLCNACGLHYAKLMRKQSKATNGEAPPIDLETLRASARAADIAEKASRASKPQSSTKANGQGSSGADSPMDTSAGPSSHASSSKPNGLPPQPQASNSATHQGSFQIMLGSNEHVQQPPQPPNQPPPQQSALTSSNAMQVDTKPPVQTAPAPQVQHHMPPPPPHHALNSGLGAMPPPPPWPTTARGSYGPSPEHIQHAHQSYMRGSTQNTR